VWGNDDMVDKRPFTHHLPSHQLIKLLAALPVRARPLLSFCRCHQSHSYFFDLTVTRLTIFGQYRHQFSIYF